MLHHLETAVEFFFYGYKQIYFLDITIALLVSHLIRLQGKLVNFRHAVLCVMIWGLGGGTVRSIILGEPVIWIKPPVFLAYFIVGSLYMKFDIFHQIYNHPRLALLRSIVLDVVIAVPSCSGAMVPMRLPQEDIRSSIVAGILCGFFTSNFGGITLDMFNLLDGENWRFRMPAVVKNPARNHKISPICALIGTIGPNPLHLGLQTPLLNPAQVRLLSIALVLLTGTINDYVFQPIIAAAAAASRTSTSKKEKRK